MDRRRFLRACTAVAAAGWLHPTADAATPKTVMTVQGPLEPTRVGAMLPHEHVLVDFIGAEKVSRDRYNRDEVVRTVLPHLRKAREAGLRTFAECTPAYIGRDPVLLQRLSRLAGLDILTNTGYYGARNDKFLPEHAFKESADALADRWVTEWENGIGDSGVRPGFIKIGVDRGSLSDVDRKLVKAAARTHRRSGLTIAAHTGPAPAAFEQLDVIEAEGLDPSAWIWVHAQAEKDLARHVAAAERGAWVEFDGVGPDSIGRHVEMVKNMKDHGLLHRVLLSHDAGWYHVGKEDGGTFRPYTTLFNELVPALRKAGVTEEEVKQLTVKNPARAFTVEVRSK